MDLDLDGFGDLNNSIFACEAPIGFILDNSDCDDGALTFADMAGDGFGGLDGFDGLGGMDGFEGLDGLDGLDGMDGFDELDFNEKCESCLKGKTTKKPFKTNDVIKATKIGESKPKASDNKNVALNLPLANFIPIFQSLSK